MKKLINQGYTSKGPVVRPLVDGVFWQLEKNFCYTAKNGIRVKALKGFVFDFASIPRFAWSILGLGKATGKHRIAALIHDWEYSTHPGTRKEADDRFLEGMLFSKVNKKKAYIAYWAVRLFGFISWDNFINSK